MPKMTAEQYRTDRPDDINSVWLIRSFDDQKIEIYDVELKQRLGMVILDTPRGIMPVMPETELCYE